MLTFVFFVLKLLYNANKYLKIKPKIQTPAYRWVWCHSIWPKMMSFWRQHSWHACPCQTCQTIRIHWWIELPICICIVFNRKSIYGPNSDLRSTNNRIFKCQACHGATFARTVNQVRHLAEMKFLILDISETWMLDASLDCTAWILPCLQVLGCLKPLVKLNDAKM